jgi:hypothetical protein
MQLFGAIEAGGTKFICAIGDSKGQIYNRIRIPTIEPQETIIKVIDFLKKTHQKTVKFLNGYIKHESILENIENYIVSPGLEENSGVCGAIALAEQALIESK